MAQLLCGGEARTPETSPSAWNVILSLVPPESVRLASQPHRAFPEYDHRDSTFADFRSRTARLGSVGVPQQHFYQSEQLVGAASCPLACAMPAEAAIIRYQGRGSVSVIVAVGSTREGILSSATNNQHSLVMAASDNNAARLWDAARGKSIAEPMVTGWVPTALRDGRRHPWDVVIVAGKVHSEQQELHLVTQR
jgi:hypothetical protein